LNYFQWADVREANDWWEDETLDADSEIEAIEFLYQITWSCNEITGFSNLSECDPDPLEIQDDDTIMLSFTRADALRYINTVGKKYRFTATLIDTYGRSGENSVEYIITTRKFPSVTISPASVVISAGQMTQLSAFVVSSGTSTPNGLVADSLSADEILNRYGLIWGTTKESLPLTEESGALTTFSTSVALDSNADGFALGATYSVMVTVFPGADYAYEGNSSAYATVRLNEPPSSGICYIDVHAGLAFITDFTVSCKSWADNDVPLKYSFELISVDNATGEYISSTPLINLSELPYYTFNAGPGVFKVGASVVDSQGALTATATGTFVVNLAAEDLDVIEDNPAEYLTGLIEGEGVSTSAAAEAGDMSKVAGFIASLSSTMDVIRFQENRSDVADSAMEASRNTMSKLLDILLDNLIPNLDTFMMLATILTTVVREIEELGPDAVEAASGTVGKIVAAMIYLLSGSYISNFPVPVVQDLSESVTKMMVKGSDLGLADELSALYDAAQTTLLESLTDTLPGQNGFDTGDEQTKIKAQRKSPDEISEASTEYADLPEFPALDGASSADTVMRADKFDIYTNTTSVGDVVSVNLFDSSSQTSSRRISKGFRRQSGAVRRRADQVEITEMDECEPIILVMQTTAFADPDALIGTGVPNVTNGTEFEFPECLSVPTSDPSSAGGASTWNSTGCTIIAWTTTNATCSCTHLSAFGADLSSFMPDFSCFTDPGIANINLESLAKNYMVVVATFLLLFILIRMMPNMEQRASDKHLLAHQFIWAERRYLLVKESTFFLEYKSKTHQYFWTRWSLLYRVFLRNAHPVFSIWLRNAGTNFTSHQRLLCVMSSLGTCLAINAIFYGFTFEAPASETTTMLIVTLIASIIPSLGKMWFAKHKMTTHTGEKQKRLEQHNQRRACLKYWIGCYCLCYPCQNWIDQKKEKRKRRNKDKLALLNKRLSRHEDMKRHEEYDLTVKSAIKGVGTSLKRTFSPHNHEAAYGFTDENGERAMVRTVKLDFSKNPFASLEETFKFFDADSSGHISRLEFKEAMDRLDHNHTAKEVEDMLTHMDLDGDGMISFAEFTHAMSNIKFEGEAEDAEMGMPTGPSIKSAKTPGIVTIEDTAGSCGEYHQSKRWDMNSRKNQAGDYNITAGDGEESYHGEGVNMGPGTTSVTTEDLSVKNAAPIDDEQLLSEKRRQERASIKKERIARTFSLDAIDLEYLENAAETVGLYRIPDADYGFESKYVSGVAKQKAITSDSELMVHMNYSTDKDSEVLKLGEVSSRRLGEMDESEFKRYNELQKGSWKSASLIMLKSDDLPSNEPSSNDSEELEYGTRNISPGNKDDFRVSPVLLDAGYIADGGDEKLLTEKEKKKLVKRTEKQQDRRNKKLHKHKKKVQKEPSKRHGKNLGNKSVNEKYRTPGGPGAAAEKIAKLEKRKNKETRKREKHIGVASSDKETLLMMLSDSSSDEMLRGNENGEGEVHQWITYYGISSMSKALVASSTLDAGKSPFMKEQSDFWISNRVANLVGGDVDRELRRVKNWELKILVELQETLLEKTFKMPKPMLKLAWCCFVFWVVGMIVIIFFWGVSMDSDAMDKPDEDIVSAAKSNCPVRNTVSTGDQLNVDVSADDALNLKGANNSANAVNANYTRYGNILPFEIPDFNFMPEDAPESLKFLTSSLFSWASGTVLLPLYHNIQTAFLLALVYRNEADRLKHLLGQKAYFRHTDIMDYEMPDQVFFICCWPDALIKILAEETREEDLIKLKLDTRKNVDKILEKIALKI